MAFRLDKFLVTPLDEDLVRLRRQSVVTRALEIIDAWIYRYETMNDFEKKKTPYQDTRARMLMEAYSKI